MPILHWASHQHPFSFVGCVRQDLATTNNSFCVNWIKKINNLKKFLAHGDGGNKMFYLIHILTKAFNVNECQVFHNLLSHFLYALVERTSLNYFEGMMLMLWIWKDSCTRLDLTWSNSTTLQKNTLSHEQTRQNKTRKEEYEVGECHTCWGLSWLWRIPQGHWTLESMDMCQDASSLWTHLMYGIHACTLWFPS